MSQKQGGKGKSSSPSDIGYWKRVSPEAQRAKRIARHAARLIRLGHFASIPNALKAAINSCEPKGKIDYGRHIPKPDHRHMVMTEAIKRTARFPLHIVISEGVTIAWSENQSDAITAIALMAPRRQYTHDLLYDTGRRQVISSRNTN